jgi:hypothetical protein
VSTHPGSSSGSGGPAVRRPVVRCPAVRCPVTWDGRRGSGRLLSTRPASSPLVSTVRCPTRPGAHPSGVQSAGVRPSVRTRPSSPHTGRGRWDQAGGAGQPSPQEPVEVPWLPCRRAARSTAQQAWGGRRCRGRMLVSGVAGGLAGWVRAAAAALDRLSDQAGQAGGQSTRGWRRRCGTGAGCGARWPRLPRGCHPVLGARPRCVVVVEADARVGGPGGRWACRLGSGAAQRGPGWQRALSARCLQRCELRGWVVGLPGLEPRTSSLSAKCR